MPSPTVLRAIEHGDRLYPHFLLGQFVGVVRFYDDGPRMRQLLNDLVADYDAWCAAENARLGIITQTRD